jgi:hypothetical protein
MKLKFTSKFFGTQFVKKLQTPRSSSSPSYLREKLSKDALGKERSAKIGRIIEQRTFRNLSKKIDLAFKKTISKPIKANQGSILIKQKTRALTTAFKISQKKGLVAGEKTGIKLGLSSGVMKSFPKDRPKNFYKNNYGISDSESRALGFAPKEPMSASKSYALKKTHEFDPVNKPFYIVDKNRKLKPIDRFINNPKAKFGTYFQPSTQTYRPRPKPKKRKF